MVLVVLVLLSLETSAGWLATAAAEAAVMLIGLVLLLVEGSIR